jgi:hypothetical protein
VTGALIRFARRLANWEQSLPVAELQKREFKARDGGPDLRPSVYEIGALESELVRAYAEHAYGIEPDREALALDVTTAANRHVATACAGPFAFTRERHREVLLGSQEELLSFIATVRDSAPRQVVSRDEVRCYVRGRLGEQDPEWCSAAG